jgi:hypothetical protein
MRPRYQTRKPYEPSRWRNRRARDIRDIAVAYMAAIGLMVICGICVALDPSWLLGHSVALCVVRSTSLVALYIGAGVLVVGFAIRRAVTWESPVRVPTLALRWYTFLFWPLLIGVMLYRMADPERA